MRKVRRAEDSAEPLVHHNPELRGQGLGSGFRASGFTVQEFQGLGCRRQG